MFNMCHWTTYIHDIQIRFSEVISWIQNLRSTNFITNIKNVVINKKVTPQFLERKKSIFRSFVSNPPSWIWWSLLQMLVKIIEFKTKKGGQCCKKIIRGRFGMCYLTIMWLVDVMSFRGGLGMCYLLGAPNHSVGVGRWIHTSPSLPPPPLS